MKPSVMTSSDTDLLDPVHGLPVLLVAEVQGGGVVPGGHLLPPDHGQDNAQPRHLPVVTRLTSQN